MKRWMILPVAGLCLATNSAADVGQPAATLRVATFNIRYDNPADGPNRWPGRRDAVAAWLNREADVAGLQ
jgi:hypothetical protein